MSTPEDCLREDLDPKVPRATVVLRPLKLIIDNLPENLTEDGSAPVHPHFPERGHRSFPISRELWIEQEGFMEMPAKGYFRLFIDPQPDVGSKDFTPVLNPNAKEVVTAYLEPGMKHALPDDRYQFERHGYSVADRVDSKPDKPVFNRVVTLKDSWRK